MNIHLPPFYKLCEMEEDEYSFYGIMAHNTLDVSNEESLKAC